MHAFSLPAALESGLAMVRERALRQGVTLSLDLDPRIDLIEADERKVKQILFNLLSNAVKFTPSGGSVQLITRPLAGGVEIAVRDTGVGIAPKEQERVFEQFYQGAQDLDRAREGTGLGLAVVKQLVELHAGRIWIESEVGVGSTFTLFLPSRQAAQAGREEPARVSAPDVRQLG